MTSKKEHLPPLKLVAGLVIVALASPFIGVCALTKFAGNGGLRALVLWVSLIGVGWSGAQIGSSSVLSAQSDLSNRAQWSAAPESRGKRCGEGWVARDKTCTKPPVQVVTQ
jgi:hypothetical protein